MLAPIHGNARNYSWASDAGNLVEGLIARFWLRGDADKFAIEPGVVSRVSYAARTINWTEEDEHAGFVSGIPDFKVARSEHWERWNEL